MSEMGLDIQVGLVDEAARRVFRRAASAHSDPGAGVTFCAMCGVEFGYHAPRKRLTDKVCEFCVLEKARDYGSFWR